MRIMLLEPYFGGSHKAWAEGYRATSRHRVELVTQPARFWKWRMQGGAATLAEQAHASGSRPDAVVATDMVNLPAFLGLTRGWLSEVPVAMYCHENQLTYPLPSGEKRDLTYAMINWLSMLAADRILFNSHHHLDDWFGELPRLLKHFPEYTHVHRIAEVRAKSAVLPVGCDLRRLDSRAHRSPPSRVAVPTILWNQRWEYDKDPETFFRALFSLADGGYDFRLILAGKSERQRAQEFERGLDRLRDRVVHYGYATAKEYGDLLRRADIVVSTALHEFFGVSVVEAVYSGCFPVVPCRLSYPEIIPGSFHERCLYEGFDGLVARLRWALDDVEAARETADALRPAVATYDWANLVSYYDQEIDDLARNTPVS